MADFEIVVDVEAAGVITDLQRLHDRVGASGLEQFLITHTHPFLQSRASNRFDNEGDDAVGQWAPLGPATQAIRSALGYGSSHPINVRTGEMRGFVEGSAADIVGGADSAILFFPERNMSSTVAKKMTTAQMGASFPATPARPVVAVSNVEEEIITRDLASYLMEGLVANII
jgi:hypothetical protein